MPKRTTRLATIGILASIGLAIGIGLATSAPAAPNPTTVADTIWGVLPPQPSPTPTVTASAATVDDTIWG